MSNKTYSIRNQEKLKAYLQKIEHDIKRNHSNDRGTGNKAQDDSNRLQRGSYGQTGVK
jgi:hypothetical protein